MDELGREDVINESVKLLLNNDARPVVFKTEGGRRTVIRLGHPPITTHNPMPDLVDPEFRIRIAVTSDPVGRPTPWTSIRVLPRRPRQWH